MPEPVELLAEQVKVAERAMIAALQPDAVWMCSGCNRPKERVNPFVAEDLREQVRHLPYSSSVVQIALFNLMDKGVLVADSRWRLTAHLEVLPGGREPEANA